MQIEHLCDVLEDNVGKALIGSVMSRPREPKKVREPTHTPLCESDTTIIVGQLREIKLDPEEERVLRSSLRNGREIPEKIFGRIQEIRPGVANMITTMQGPKH